MNKFVVITTIYPKSDGIRALENRGDWRIVLVGDKRSVDIPCARTTTLLSLNEQRKLPFRLAKSCPVNHYSRKNIGYLYAVANGAQVIFDTDDDNIPLENWTALPFVCGRRLRCSEKFVNIYKPFTSEFIWPRGFPPDEILKSQSKPMAMCNGKKVKIAVWQGLTDEEPDVDALYCLVINRNIRFSGKKAFYLSPKQFCSVNSQNSLWEQRAFPYLYLPASVNFRFTDILRGYVAQRLLWQDGLHVGVTQATVRQRRNPHDVMKDFSDEVPVFTHIKEIAELIESVRLGANSWDNLFAIYERLVAARFVGRNEMRFLNLWHEAFLQIEGKPLWKKRNS